MCSFIVTCPAGCERRTWLATLMSMEDLDHPVGQPYLDVAADQLVRHRGEGFVHFDVVVGVDLDRFPFGVFE